MKEDGTLTLNGYTATRTLILNNGNTTSDTTSESVLTFNILNNDGTTKEKIKTEKYKPKTVNVYKGEKIRVYTPNNMNLPPSNSPTPPSGTFGGTTTYSASVKSTGDMYYHNTSKHRVESHT